MSEKRRSDQDLLNTYPSVSLNTWLDSKMYKDLLNTYPSVSLNTWLDSKM